MCSVSLWPLRIFFVFYFFFFHSLCRSNRPKIIVASTFFLKSSAGDSSIHCFPFIYIFFCWRQFCCLPIYFAMLDNLPRLNFRSSAISTISWEENKKHKIFIPTNRLRIIVSRIHVKHCIKQSSLHYHIKRI